MRKDIPQYEFEWLKALRLEGNTYRECAEYMGTRSAAALRAMAQRTEYIECKARFPDQDPMSSERMVRVEAELDFEPTSLEELAEALNVNLEDFDIEALTINTYPVQTKDGPVAGYQIKARLRPLAPARTLGVMEDLKADLNKHNWSLPHNEPRSDFEGNRHLMVVDVFDHHFGMLAWGKETGGEDWDMQIAEDRFRDAFRQAAGLAQVMGVDEIVVPLGNDLVHSEGGWGEAGSGGMTMRGTHLDVDTRYRKVYRKVRIACCKAIDALTEIAPVTVVIVPGNHAGQTEFTLGDSLECWYRNTESVRIWNGPALRKYFRWEDVLLGFTHGDKEKRTQLPMIMATEAADEWSSSTYREWQIGHFHFAKRQEFVPVEDMNGVVVRQCPSLTSEDAWHAARGYVMRRQGAEVNFYLPDRHVATFTLE